MSSNKECPVRRGFFFAFWRKKKKPPAQTKITDCVIELYITLARTIKFYNLIIRTPS